MIPCVVRLLSALVASALLLSACGSSGAGSSAAPRTTADETIPVIPGDTTTVAPRPTGAGVDVPIKSARFDAQADAEPQPAPISLRINDIDIEAPIVPVGVEPNDELEVPGSAEVGWYEFGPRPGEKQGSAVLAAHVDYNGRPGVFFELRTLAAGDELDVEFEDGTVRQFEVVSLDQYTKDELPFERVFARSGEPVLTLITCGGDFDPSARSYTDNVVVYAIPV
jgi:LPXTG-site transpeptidase (sortase) family protein